jgi:tRNA(Arg) A34 adenosine deaminase TadA
MGASSRSAGSGHVWLRLMALLFVVAVGLMVAAYVHPVLRPASVAENQEVQALLVALADSALTSRDVPVAAVVLYGDSVIGRGFNTVVRDGNAGGHAEINAISSGFRGRGEKAFRALNRDSLVLVTTLEPCPMCRGAITGYGIRKVRILKPKPLMMLVREDLRMVRYYFERRLSGPEGLQDSLLHRHPDYRERDGLLVWVP